jgi:hypothetical protein
LFLSEATFTIEVLLQECEVGLRWIMLVVKLLIGRLVESRGLYIWNI